ncbi:MAG TPA: hypothetical protein VFE61_23625, partial [Candidatus Sulfotelmatobacter sp.]|nr:hypothetical protein [Candidatus Sulfotelmatobacter sp.]
QRVTGGTHCLAARRQPFRGGTSRMNREIHVRLCERLGAKFPGPTRRSAGDRRPYADQVALWEVSDPHFIERCLWTASGVPKRGRR